MSGNKDMRSYLKIKYCLKYILSFSRELYELFKPLEKKIRNKLAVIIQFFTLLIISFTLICNYNMIEESKKYRIESLRPWLDIADLEITPVLDAISIQLEYNFRIINYGNSPAEDVQVSSGLFYEDDLAIDSLIPQNNVFATIFQGDYKNVNSRKFYKYSSSKQYKSSYNESSLINTTLANMQWNENVEKKKLFIFINISYIGPGNINYSIIQKLYLKPDYNQIVPIIIESEIN